MSHDQLEDEAGSIVTAMQRAVADVRPPVDRLAATAQARGRAVRRRRNAIAVTSVGVVLALGGAGLAHLGAPTADEPAPVTVPEEEPTSEWWRQSRAEMTQRLRKLLPDNVRIDSAAAPDAHAGLLRARVTNLMAGTGGMTVRLVPPAPGQRLSCPERLTPPDTCVVTAGSAGATQVREWHRTVGELDVIRVDVAVEGGGLVQVAAANTLDAVWNASAEAWGPEPSVSMSDLLAIAESPTWLQGGPPSDD